MRRLELDGLRGIAILATIVYHYAPHYDIHRLPWYAYGFFKSLWSGVDIFFVLSGFLIGGIVMDNRDASNFFRVFYTRRALRILPVAFLTLAVAYILLPFVGVADPQDSSVPFFAYFFFINNYWSSTGHGTYPPLNPFWSLAIEEQFYLMAPLCMVLFRKHWTAILVFIVIASPIARTQIHIGWDFTFLRLDGFAWGMLAATAVRSVKIPKESAYVAAALVCVAVIWGIHHKPTSIGITLNCMATDFLILAMRENTALAKLFSAQWLVTMGKYSYFMYLLHFPIDIVVTWTPLPPVITPLVSFALCFATAWMSWRRLEAPLLAFGKKMEYVTSLSRMPVSFRKLYSRLKTETGTH